MVDNHVSRTCTGVYRAVEPVLLLYRLIQSHSDPKTETWTDSRQRCGSERDDVTPGTQSRGTQTRSKSVTPLRVEGRLRTGTRILECGPGSASLTETCSVWNSLRLDSMNTLRIIDIQSVSLPCGGGRACNCTQDEPLCVCSLQGS